MDSGWYLNASFWHLIFVILTVILTYSSASTMCAVSMMGGVFAILPAYEADLFGTKFVGAIHGRMLLFSSAAALAGEVMYSLLTTQLLYEKQCAD